MTFGKAYSQSLGKYQGKTFFGIGSELWTLSASIVVLIKEPSKRGALLGDYATYLPLVSLTLMGPLSGVYVCYTNRSLWNRSFCYDVFDLEARSSLVLLVYLLEDIAWKNHLQDRCFPLMSFWRFRGIVFQIPQFPSVCADFHQGNKKKTH